MQADFQVLLYLKYKEKMQKSCLAARISNHHRDEYNDLQWELLDSSCFEVNSKIANCSSYVFVSFMCLL